MPTWDEAVDLFERRRKAWLADDLDAYLELWADDMTFQSPVHDEPLIGKTPYEELVRRSAAFVKPLAFDVVSLAPLTGRSCWPSGRSRWSGARKAGRWHEPVQEPQWTDHRVARVLEPARPAAALTLVTIQHDISC